MKTPELYEENLITLMKVMDSLGDVSGIDGVFACEIRVKVDDLDSWAVIGWGDQGDPCVLRFDKDAVIPVRIPGITGMVFDPPLRGSP